MSQAKKGEDSKPERYLEGAQVILGKVQQKTMIQSVVLSWRLQNYKQLKNDVLYFKLYESAGTTYKLRMLKTEESLYLCVSGRAIPKITNTKFLIMAKDSLKSVTETGEEITSGFFAAKFRNESFMAPDLDFLGDDGTLTVSFKYSSGVPPTYQHFGIETAEIICDCEQLCHDFKNMYYEALCSDFLIHVKDYSFKTHKFMLSARSEFFEEFFTTDKNAAEYRLDFEFPGLVHEVLVYIYSAELKDMSLESMLKVYELACKLKVKPLCSRCRDDFKDYVIEDCWSIAKLSVKLDDSDLRDIVVHYLCQYMPDSDIVKYFRHVKLECERGRVIQ